MSEHNDSLKQFTKALNEQASGPLAPAEEFDDPETYGLPPSKQPLHAMELTEDDGSEWLIGYAHVSPGRTGRYKEPLFTFYFEDSDGKRYEVTIRGGRDYRKFKWLMHNFIWAKLPNLRPRPPIASIVVRQVEGE